MTVLFYFGENKDKRTSWSTNRDTKNHLFAEAKIKYIDTSFILFLICLGIIGVTFYILMIDNIF